MECSCPGEWREACSLPVDITDAQSVVIGHKVILGRGTTADLDSTADATIYVYDINRDYWDIHSIAPTYLSALTTYRSQLVLAGGREVASDSVTNSVYLFENGEWCSSIPAMTVARSSASAVSSGQHLIVAGGYIDLDYEETDIVEVFDGHSWANAQPLPEACCDMKSVLYNDEWYVCGGEGQGNEVYSAPLQSVVKSIQSIQSTVWTKLPPAPHQYSSFAISRQRLLAVGGGWPPTSAVHAFSPHSQSWLHVGDLPIAVTSSSSINLPNGELMTLGGYTIDNYSEKVIIGKVVDTKYGSGGRVERGRESELVLAADEVRQILTMNEQLGKKVLELEADNKHLRERLEEAERKDRDHVVSDEGRKAGLEKGSKEAEGRHSSPEKLGAPIRGADIVARTTVTQEGEEGEWKEREYEGSMEESAQGEEAGLEESGQGGEAGLEKSGQGGEAGLEKGSLEAEGRHRNPENICAPIRGADIVARTTVPLAAGEGCTYEWKGHGLRLQVPADALESLSPPATITIQASLSGHYHLPDNTQLVSAVYWIAFPGKFSRPVTLEVQHCAALEQSHTLSSLSFVRAKCSQETLPYNFKPIQGGVFSASSRHGAIELSHFSGVGIASEDSEQSKHYTAHTFYIPQSPTTWLMHFIIICDLELLFRAVEKHYFGKGAETGPYLEVAFDRDEVAMEIEEDGVTLDNGWSLVPLVCPTSILRESVDNFKPGKPIPSCQLELYWTKREQPPDRLKHRLKLTGVRRHTSITITRDPTLPDRRTRGSDYKKAERKSNRDSDTVPQPAATNVLDIDDLIDVKCELIPIASKWKDIGLALRLKPTTLDTIEKNRKDVKDCLSDVLTQWLNKAYNMQRFGQPSWQLLVSAVRHPAGGDNQALADTMAAKYGVS